MHNRHIEKLDTELKSILLRAQSLMKRCSKTPSFGSSIKPRTRTSVQQFFVKQKLHTASRSHCKVVHCTAQAGTEFPVTLNIATKILFLV